MKKKAFSALSLIAAGSIGLSGCGTESNPQETPSQTLPSREANPTPQERAITPPPPPPLPFEEGAFDDANGNPIPPAEKDIPEGEDPSDDNEVSAVMGYNNGTYTASGLYMSPAGEEGVDVEVVLENGTITGVSVTPRAEDDTSIKLQTLFAQGIPSVVVGKKIEEVDRIAAVNGSSLTGKGFMDALEAIKDEASL